LIKVIVREALIGDATGASRGVLVSVFTRQVFTWQVFT
jgi:hypothetical protein